MCFSFSLSLISSSLVLFFLEGTVPLLIQGSFIGSKDNYRPISVLSNFSKIFEKTMYHHLYKYLEKFKILYPLQSGFRENCSNMHALISITESIRQSIDNNEFVCGKFIDSKKPFNTVNLRILLTKLNHYRIRGIALEWFESYLSHRLQ